MATSVFWIKENFHSQSNSYYLVEDHIKLGIKKALPVTSPASLGNLYHPVFYSCLQTHFSELLCMTEPIFSRTTGKLLGNYGNIQKCFLLINECLFKITTIIFPWVLNPLNGLITKKRSIILIYFKIFRHLQQHIVIKLFYYQVIHPSACLHYRSIGRFPPSAPFS